MVHNDACPEIRVDPDTFQVWIDGDEVVEDPATLAPAGPALLAVLNPLALLLADSRFPSGSYAHSLGPRAGGERRADRRPGLHPRPAATGGEADARFAVEARRRRACVRRRYARAHRPPAYASRANRPLEREWCARTPSAMLRDAARRLGSQLLRSAASKVWDVAAIAPLAAAAAARARRRRRRRGRVRRGDRAAGALRRRRDGRVRRAEAAPARPGRDRALARRAGAGAWRRPRGRSPPTTARCRHRPRSRSSSPPPSTSNRESDSLPVERALRIGVGGPVGSGKSCTDRRAVRCAERRGPARRRDQRHLHDRGRRVPALHRRPAGGRGSPRSRPAAARTPRSATTSPPTSRPSRSSRRRPGRSTSSSSRAAATT